MNERLTELERHILATTHGLLVCKPTVTVHLVEGMPVLKKEFLKTAQKSLDYFKSLGEKLDNASRRGSDGNRIKEGSRFETTERS